MERVRRVNQLWVYGRAYELAMELFEASRAWPKAERYALTDQVRRSSRSVCANLAEAWAKRAYRKHFASKLSDAHAEAEETIVWIEFARDCHYLDPECAAALGLDYRRVIAGLVRMKTNSGQWTTER